MFELGEQRVTKEKASKCNIGKNSLQRKGSSEFVASVMLQLL